MRNYVTKTLANDLGIVTRRRVLPRSSTVANPRLAWTLPRRRHARPFYASALRSNTPTPEVAAPGSSSSVGPAKDPEHPYLWYHPSPSAQQIGLSFLQDSPSPGSRTVLGNLPMVQSSGLNDFQENPEFLTLLHDLIRDGLEANVSKDLEFEASTRPTDGYLNLCDERALPPAGRIAEPEDTLGMVFVESGRIDAKTYQPMPSYRLVTANGPLILPRGLDTYVRDRLSEIATEERA